MKLKFFITTAFFSSLAALAVMPVFASTNLVTNGSFESPVTPDPSANVYPKSVLGGWVVQWLYPTSTPEEPLMEIQHNTYSPTKYGVQYAELDGDWDGPAPGRMDSKLAGEHPSVLIYQDVPTSPNVSYSVSFAFAPRPYTEPEDNVLEAKWGNTILDTITGDGYANYPSQSVIWTDYYYTVTGVPGNSTRIQFADRGNSDSWGTFLDNVIVTTSYQPPTNLTATPGGVGGSGNCQAAGIALGWTAPTDPSVIGYKVFRNNTELALVTGRTTVSYQDVSAVSGQTYKYFVKAVYIDQDSPASNTASATAPALCVDATVIGTPNPATVGSQVTWTATPSGTCPGPFTYSWTGTDGLTGATQSVNKTYSTTGSKNATVTITASGCDSATVTAPIPVTVSEAQIVLTVVGTPNPATVGSQVTWTATPSGTCPGPFTYSWTGTDGLTGATQSVNKTYSTTGNKNATVTVSAPGCQTATQSSTAPVVVQGTVVQSVACSAAPSVVHPGVKVTWTATPTPPDTGGTYTYSWFGAVTGSTRIVYANNGYTTIGTKSATVTVTGASSKTCTTNVKVVQPSTEEF